MGIEELIARCPPFSKVLFHVRTACETFYGWAEPGDVIELVEGSGRGLTGRRVTALVIAAEGRRRAQGRTVTEGEGEG